MGNMRLGVGEEELTKVGWDQQWRPLLEPLPHFGPHSLALHSSTHCLQAEQAEGGVAPLQGL